MIKRWLIILTCCLFLFGCKDEQDKSSKAPPRFVKSTQLGSIDAKGEKNYPATVSATQKVELAFQVPGQIIKLPIAKGQIVIQGMILAELDPRDYQHDLDEKKAILEQNKKDYARFVELLRTDSIAKVKVDAKKADYEVAKAQTASAQKALDDTNLRAPFDGVIADKFVENFENIKAKQPILSLQDITFVEFIINVPEQDVFHVEEIAGINPDELGPIIGKIRLESLPNKGFPVHLKEYSTEADENTQTYEVTLTMENPEHVNILPGMTATFIPDRNGAEAGTYLVPITAVFNEGNGQSYIWVVGNDSKVSKQPVELGSMEENYIQIKSSEKPGTTIVTAGAHYIQEGMEVRTDTPKE